MVEIFFGIITRQAIRRGTFSDVVELETAIRNYIDSYNNAPNRSPGPKPQTSYSTKSNVNQSTTRWTLGSCTGWVHIPMDTHGVCRGSPLWPLTWGNAEWG